MKVVCWDVRVYGVSCVVVLRIDNRVSVSALVDGIRSVLFSILVGFRFFVFYWLVAGVGGSYFFWGFRKVELMKVR